MTYLLYLAWKSKRSHVLFPVGPHLSAHTALNKNDYREFCLLTFLVFLNYAASLTSATSY